MGPICGVLLAHPFGPAEQALMDELVRLTGDNRYDERFFGASDTTSIGGTYRGEPLSFEWAAEEFEMEDRDPAAFQASFGWLPVLDLQLASACNGMQEHRVLGEMARWLASRTGGFVDLSGDPGRLPSDLDGQVVMIPYRTWGDELAHCYYLDEVAMRSWLACLDFGMVK
jgi:hypothetical protein